MSPKPVKAEVPDYAGASGVASAGEGGEGWHPDLPRVKFEALLGKRFLIDEVDFRDSEFKEGSQYALIRFRPVERSVPGILSSEDEAPDEDVLVESGESATTSTGGVRVVDQLKRTEAFPAKAELGQEKTKTGYNMWVLK